MTLYSKSAGTFRTAALATFVAAAAMSLWTFLDGSASAQLKPAPAATVPVEELMKPGELPDIGIGKDDAKITVIEYSSMTCGHCARFAKDVFPKLREKYIDTGKVRFISREFPLDNLAAAASMLTRCTDKAKSFDLVETLFHTQDKWATSEPLPKLLEVAKQAGFSKENFDTCLKDQKLLDQLVAARKLAGEKFQINATPTFFINGQRLTGGYQLADFEKVIDPMLAAK